MRRPGRRPGTESAWDGGDDLQASQCSWDWWSWRKPRIENDPANRRRFAILVPPPRRQPWHVRARPNRPCTLVCGIRSDAVHMDGARARRGRQDNTPDLVAGLHVLGFLHVLGAALDAL